MARLAIFIDGGYLDALAEREFGVRVDLELLARRILSEVGAKTPEPVDLFRALYYHCPPYQGNPPTEEERRRYASRRAFFDAVRRIPRFDVREGRLEYRGLDAAGKKVFAQKRVDLMLGLDFALLSSKRQISHVALLAGDSDFIPAFEVAKSEGVNAWLFHGPRTSRSYHLDLWMAADERVEMDRSFIESIRRAP
ncbi:MAG TPA: NYN domain-containing protein [Thermoanaerobaculia bacterium]